MQCMDKIQMRRYYRAMRDALSPAEAAAASARICAHLAAWPILQQAETVLAYLAFRNEVDLSAVLAAFPAKRWIVPRTLSQPAPHLMLHIYQPGRLVRHKFGMLEPDPALPVVPPAELDLILVPGLVFDRCGQRLGLGGGFYDRFLPGVRAIKAGMVYRALWIDAVPVEAHDQRMDYIVCEDGVQQVETPA